MFIRKWWFTNYSYGLKANSLIFCNCSVWLMGPPYFFVTIAISLSRCIHWYFFSWCLASLYRLNHYRYLVIDYSYPKSEHPTMICFHDFCPFTFQPYTFIYISLFSFLFIKEETHHISLVQVLSQLLNPIKPVCSLNQKKYIYTSTVQRKSYHHMNPKIQHPWEKNYDKNSKKNTMKFIL